MTQHIYRIVFHLNQGLFYVIAFVVIMETLRKCTENLSLLEFLNIYL